MKPYRPFEQPSDIIADPDLSNAEKGELLIQWHEELLREQDASKGTAVDHNGHSRPDAPNDAGLDLLARVRLCLAALKDGPAPMPWDSDGARADLPEEPGRKGPQPRSNGSLSEDR